MRMKKRCRLVSMPEHLERECNQILAEEFADVPPDAEMTSKEYNRRYDAAIAAKGSEELRAWCKMIEETVAQNRREGRELA